MLDYYRTLQVDPQASKEVIEKAYRALSLKYHPDKIPASDDEDRERVTREWMKIRAAYEVLSDDKKRMEYDKTRKHEMFNLFLNEGLLGLARRYLH